MLTNPQDLPVYIRQRLEQVIRTTGSKVAIEEAEQLEFDSEVGYASGNSAVHHIRYTKSYCDHREHFILSSLEKIARFFAAPADQRYLPVILREYLPREEEAELARRVPSVSGLLVRELSQRLAVGLVRQLLSFPLDVRVELELSTTLPEHRERQLAYMRAQLQDLQPHFSLQIEAFSPPWSYAASSTMNCAFAEVCARLTGERPARAIRFSPYRKQGQRLVELLDQVAEQGHVGDRQAQDRWAMELQMVGWHDWIRWDQV